MFEIKFVSVFAVIYFNFHIFGSVLRCAKTETVQSQRICIIGVFLVIFAARIHFVEQQIPVVSALFFVELNGNATSEVGNFKRKIRVRSDNYLISVTAFELVDGIRNYLKKRMAAPFDTVRAENNSGRCELCLRL